MASFNRVVLMGNLTRDPQVKYTPGGTAVCEIGLAINRTWFDKAANAKKEEVTFVDVTLWGRTAEVAGEYLVKGANAMIEGRLQLESWVDKTSGEKRQKLKVVGESLVLLESKGSGKPPSEKGTRTETDEAATADNFSSGGIPDDEVPV